MRFKLEDLGGDAMRCDRLEWGWRSHDAMRCDSVYSSAPLPRWPAGCRCSQSALTHRPAHAHGASPRAELLANLLGSTKHLLLNPFTTEGQHAHRGAIADLLPGLLAAFLGAWGGPEELGAAFIGTPAFGLPGLGIVRIVRIVFLRVRPGGAEKESGWSVACR